jgi:sugar (pentulose or hexulose) kinase
MLHLPQYLSYVFSGQPLTEITSLGCHTHLWDFRKHDYHAWVVKSGLVKKFPPISKAPVAGTFEGIPVGLGYHDSSAALMPYLQKHHDPFVLVSTGTWCISMNPFNDTPLTIEDFGDDCLCYLTPEGKQVKSSRLFAGPMHEQIEEVLRSHYGLSGSNIKDIAYDPKKIPIPKIRTTTNGTASETIEEYVGLDAEEHYHLGIRQIIQLLKPKIERVLTPNVKQIFVDGGFSKNKVFMGMLLDAFPSHQVSAASVPQASALGAAIVMREFWD